jgi:multidrug resistance protein, MATE family
MKNNVYPLLKLISPLVLTGLVQSAVVFFETVFLSHLSPENLAAGALVSWSFGTVLVIVFGILSSINILIAHKYGSQDEESIFLIVRDGLSLAILFGIPTSLLFWNMSPLFLLLGQSPAIVLLAKTYSHAMAWGILPNVIMIALFEVFIGLGHVRLIFLFNILSVFLTIFFSFSLIFGKFGLPMLNIAGAGWGSTISNWILLIIAGCTLMNKNYKRYFQLIFDFTKPSYLKDLLHVGTPMGVMYFVEVSFFFTLTLIMSSYDYLVMAANQVALQYLGVLTIIFSSTAQAITARMGHLLGAGNYVAAENSAYIGVFISLIFMVPVAFFFWFFPFQLISIDFDVNKPENEKIVCFATQFLMVGALFQIFDAIKISLFGALCALKDTHFTLYTSIFSFWGVALPVGYFMATHMALKGLGLWWGMVLASSLSVLLLLWRFKFKIKHY